PTADTGQYANILFTLVRVGECITDHAGTDLEFPELLTGLCIKRFEPTIQCAVEHQVGSGRQCATPGGEFLLVVPLGLVGHRIISCKAAHDTVRTREHGQGRTRPWLTGDVLVLNWFV